MNRWMKYFRWRFISAIKIRSTERAPVVSVNYSVYVDHGDDFENKLFPEGSSFRCITHQKVDQPFHHPRRIRLTWVNPCRNEYALFGESLLRLRVLVLGCNSEEFTLIACKSPAQGVSIEEVLRVGVPLNF